MVNNNFKDMANEVDAIIIARDDWKSHYKFAKFFLKKKIKVFIDKPLTLSKNELIFFSKYLKSKLLMSCSALRFAKEYKKVKNLKVNNIQMYTVNSFNKYLIHMIELAYLIGFKKIKFFKKSNSEIKAITNNGKVKINLSNKNKNHCLKLYKNKKLIKKVIFTDNFYMFRETLKNYICFCNNEKTYSYNETINIINNLIILKKR